MRLTPAPRAPLGSSDVHVFVASPDDASSPSDRAHCRSLLCERERARCDRFVFERDRTLYLVAHALLRSALSCFTGVEPSAWRFVHNAFGRPEIARGFVDKPIRFSLSHTHGLAIVAVALDRDVGVDVEEVRCSLSMDDVASYALTARERGALEAMRGVERRRRFFEIWTLKEAYIKAIGTGLSTPPDRIELAWTGAGPNVSFDRKLRDDARRWTFLQLFPSTQHVAAVALRAPAAARARLVVHASAALSPFERHVA
jgi:4'-phosphopantetheinyl transferase